MTHGVEVRAQVILRLRAAGCVFAEDEATVLLSAATGADQLASMVARRAAGEPLELVVGWAEFCGLRIEVRPGVFLPRRRTEFLVHHAVSVADGRAGLVLLDLCCGSGAVGVALSVRLAGAELHSSDVMPAAVGCARRNVGPRGRVYEGDLYAPLPESLCGRVDLLTANVPYVPTDEVRYLPTEAREHEPLATLDGGGDGLEVLRRVAAGAPRWLAPGGHLLTETSEQQAAAAHGVMAAAGLVPDVLTCEELGATVVVGTSPPLR